MNLSLQRALFSAEDNYSSLKAEREKSVAQLKRLFLYSSLVVFFASLFPFFFFNSRDPEINKLVGFATGFLMLIALLFLIIYLSLWRRAFDRKLSIAENQLVAAQKSFIQETLEEPTLKNVFELGFPRGNRRADNEKLGETIAKDKRGLLRLFELYHTSSEGYLLTAKAIEPETRKLDEPERTSP